MSDYQDQDEDGPGWEFVAPIEAKDYTVYELNLIEDYGGKWTANTILIEADGGDRLTTASYDTPQEARDAFTELLKARRAKRGL